MKKPTLTLEGITSPQGVEIFFIPDGYQIDSLTHHEMVIWKEPEEFKEEEWTK